MANIPALPMSGQQLRDTLVDLNDDPPIAHSHAIADVTGLQAALDSKTPVIFDTDAEAAAYAAANPGAVVFSREGA